MPGVRLVLASAMLLATSVAYAGEKVGWSGTNEDLIVLSEVTSNVPGHAGHMIKQIAETWTHRSRTDPIWEGATAMAVEHQDINNGNVTVRGYGTSTIKAGDQLYYSWEGSAKVDGENNMSGSGSFQWTGGTGKFQNIKGGGKYTCAAGPKTPLKCDWTSQGEIGS